MRRFGRYLLLLAVLTLSSASAAQIQGTSLSLQPRQVDLSEPADQKRDEVIAELQKIIPRVDKERQAELQFRLAESYWEKSRFAYNKEYRRFDNAYQAWVDGGRKGQEPGLDKFTEQTEKFRNLALKQYQAIIDSKSKYERLDEVLFMLAYNQMESGRKKEGRENLRRLVEQFPESPFAADAELALGEDAFNSNDLVKAEAAYQRAYEQGLKSEKTSTYVYALYKLAWCDFNRHNFEASLQKFQEVVRLSEEAALRLSEGSSGKKDAVQLQREALGDVVKTFAQVGNVANALAYFREKAPKGELYNLTLRLARAFNEQGDSQKEIETYENLIALEPQNPALASHLAAILAAHAALNQYDAIKEVANKIAEECKDKQQSKPCEIAEAKVRDITTNFHKFAQSDRYQKDYQAARELYEIYLPTFTKYPDHHRLAFYYADLLWDIGELENAAKAYDAVIALDHKGENALISAMNAVMAYEKVVRNEPRPEFIEGRLSQIKNEKKVLKAKIAVKAETPSGTVEAQTLSEMNVALVKACDQYVALVEELGKTKELEEDVMNTRYKAAYLYQTHFQFEEANTRFGEIIRRWPSSKMAQDAVILVLDGDDARKDWGKLSLHANEFAANKTLMSNKALASTIQKFVEGAAFNKIASKETAASPDEKILLAQDYEQFVQKYPKSSFAWSALFNALLIYRDHGQDEVTIRVGQKLLTDYKDKLAEAEMEEKGIAPTTILAIAKAEENRFAFSQAAKTSMLFVNRYSTKPESRDMLYNAAILELRAGNLEEALSLFDRNLRANPKGKDSAQILFLVASIHEQRNEFEKARATYGKLISSDISTVGPLQQLKAQFAIAQIDFSNPKAKNPRKSCNAVVNTYGSLTNEQKQTGEARKARAYCDFMSREPEREAFAKISMNVPPAKLRKQINAKKESMEHLAQAYLHILSYGDDEWGIAALYRAAQAQIDYVKALRGIPDPTGLDEEALRIFREELENIVAPVESDAVQALEQALARAFELKVYTTYTKELRQTLLQYYPSPLLPFVWDFATIKDLPKIDIDKSKPEDAANHVYGMLALSAFTDDNENLSRWAAERSIAENQDAGAMYELLGQWELRHGRIANAAAIFSKGCETQPINVSACANLGAIALEFGDFKKASETYRKAKDADPKTALWAMALGYALAASGESEKAIAELSATLAQNTAAKEAYACMCMIYRNQKSDAQTALEWCNKYRGKNSGMLSDRDPMKSVISSLEMELKSIKPQTTEPSSNTTTKGGG